MGTVWYRDIREVRNGPAPLNVAPIMGGDTIASMRAFFWTPLATGGNPIEYVTDVDPSSTAEMVTLYVNGRHMILDGYASYGESGNVICRLVIGPRIFSIGLESAGRRLTKAART